MPMPFSTATSTRSSKPTCNRLRHESTAGDGVKQKLHDYLLQRPSGATPEELLGLIFKSAGSHPDLGARFLETLLAGDSRFVWRSAEGKWAASDHQALAQPLDEATFIVLDLETTGIGSGASSIMEIGAVRVSRGRVVDELSQLVNPGVRLPPYVAKLTGIDDRMLRQQPQIRDVWPRVAEFLGDSVIVAHNASFDLAFLDAAATWFDGAPLSNARLCSLRLARRVLPGLQRSGIDALAAEFGIPIADRHRALGDARITAEIFFHLIEKLKANGIARLDEALDFQNQARDGRPFVCLLPRRKIEELPLAPGIYRFFDEDGKLLYIGRAKSLRERVWSYTTNSNGHSNKTLELIRRVRDVRVEVLGSELEAALEEASAIRRERPPYNRLGKHLPQIAFLRLGLSDEYPRLSIARRLSSGRSRYAGPFRNRKEAERMANVITRHYQLRMCPGRLQPDESFSPCFQGQIGSCTAPCAARVTTEGYASQVEEYLALLDGDTDAIEERLAKRREAQAELLQFEAVASTQRDASMLRRLARRQRRLGWISSQQSFVILQRAVDRPLVLAYGVINGLLAVRARLVDESQVAMLADELSERLREGKSAGRTEESIDGTTILAAWMRDRQEDEGYIFAIEDREISAEQLSEWRAACGSLLSSPGINRGSSAL
jgi:DNA polymerase-3 subunit epsilon